MCASPTQSWIHCHLWAFFALPMLIALAAYGWTLGDPFLSDDFWHLFRAAESGSWSEAWQLGSNEGMVFIRPVNQLSFYGQWKLLGLEPFGYRLVNVVANGLNAGMVAWLTALLVGNIRSGSVAGITFALLPIHPEAVTWISGRVDVFCTMGALVSLLAWTRYLSKGGRSRHLLLGSFALVIALASKEMGCVVPPLAGLIWLRMGRPELRRALLGLGCLGAIAIVYFGLRFWLLNGLGGIVRGDESVQASFDLLAAVKFNLRAWVFMLVPLHGELHPEALHGLRLLPLAGLSVLCIQAFRREGRRDVLSIGIFAVLMVGVATLPVAGGWSRIHGEDFQSTRYLYLPSVFSCLFLGALFRDRRPSELALAIGSLGLILVPYAVQQSQVNGTWHRAAQLSEHVLTSVPEPGQAQQLFVSGLQDNEQGAYMFRVGFARALSMRSAWQADNVKLLTHEKWIRQRSQSLANPESKSVFLRWDAGLGWVGEAP